MYETMVPKEEFTYEQKDYEEAVYTQQKNVKKAGQIREGQKNRAHNEIRAEGNVEV